MKDEGKARAGSCFSVQGQRNWLLIIAVVCVTALIFQRNASPRYEIVMFGNPVDIQNLCLSSSADPSKPRLLVTGAAGFIGSHFSALAQEQGYFTLGLDNFNDYYPVSLKEARSSMLKQQNVTVVKGDINNKELLGQIFAQCNITHVVHLAAQAGVRYGLINPGSYVHSNVAGFVTLLEVARRQDPMPRIVYASSSSVYGKNEKTPFSETDAVDRPASLYAATKREKELLAHVYYSGFGMSLTGLRFFTVYGPFGRPDMAYFSFTRKILTGTKITVFQKPDKSELMRDFTYIGDITQGIMGAVNTIPASTKATAHNEIYNLGNKSPHSVSELVDTLEEQLGRKARREFETYSKGDVEITFADISKAEAELGYDPKTDLATGLQQFVKWYWEYYGEDHKLVQPDDWKYQPY